LIFVEMQTLFQWMSNIPSVVNECCSSPNGTKLTSLSSSLQKSSRFVWNPGCSLYDILPKISSACQHNSTAISFLLNCQTALPCLQIYSSFTYRLAVPVQEQEITRPLHFPT
jgi:hypothetical protein